MKLKIWSSTFALGMMVCCAATSQEEKSIKVVKIGHVAPLTGVLGNPGKDNERGFLMAIEDLNAKKLKIGGQEIRFEALSLDDGAATEFERAVLAFGGELRAREFTHDRATDFAAIIQTISAQQPDLIFFGGMDTTAARFVRQVNQAGLVARILGPDGICTHDLVRMVGDAHVDGQVICFETGGTLLDHAPAMAEWSKRFRALFNVPVQLYAPYVYDATMVMVAAMQMAKSTDPKMYGLMLKALSYEGVTGPISFESNGDLKNGAVTVYGYRNAGRYLMEVMR